MASLSELLSDTPPPPEGAGFLVRAVARVIDTLVLAALAVAVSIVVAVLLTIGSAFRGEPVDPLALDRLSRTPSLAYLASFLAALAMQTLAEGLHGSTLGKRLCGLTVVAEDLRPATVGAAMKRNVAFFWDALFFGLVAAQKMSQSPRRQRYGDAWAGTQVVRLSSLEPSRRRSWVRFLLVTTASLALAGLLLFVELALRLA